MRRIALDKQSWMRLDEGWLAPDEADGLLHHLLDTEPWEQVVILARGKPVPQPRLSTWAGTLPYRYSGQTLAPRPWPPALERLRSRLQAELDTPFNHVVLNWYRDQQDTIGFHADDEPELGPSPVIAAVSLGASRRFKLRAKKRRRHHQLVLRHGSLLLMEGATQHRWYHAVPRESGAREPRINLTFRQLLGPPGWRQASETRRPR